MRSPLSLAICLCLLSTAPARAAAAPSVAIVSTTAGQQANRLGVEQLLVQAASAAGYTALAPEQAAARLDSQGSGATRRRAAALLREAAGLVRQVAYDEALRKLESAETAALDGLARFLEPKLLAEIYFQRGVALLPTDEEAARRYLAQSLTIAPASRAGPGVSPKIAAALARAARLAALTPPAPPSLAEAARAAAGLRVRFLLVLDGRQHSGRASAAAGLFLFDAEQQSWAAARIETGDDREVLRIRVQRAVRGLLPPRASAAPTTSPIDLPVPERPRAAARWRRPLPWIASAAGVALLAAGSALLVTARSRADEYQGLAGQAPPLEYDGRPRELEESGRRFNTAGIVCLSVGGAAAVAALVLWLLPSRPSPDGDREVRFAPPGMLRFALDLP